MLDSFTIWYLEALKSSQPGFEHQILVFLRPSEQAGFSDFQFLLRQKRFGLNKKRAKWFPSFDKAPAVSDETGTVWITIQTSVLKGLGES